MKRALFALLVVGIFLPIMILIKGGQYATGGAIATAAYTIPASLILGLPAFLVFLRRGWLAWWHTALGGACIGAICSLPFAVSGWQGLTLFFPVFVGYGVVLATLFWLIGIWKNGDLIRRVGRQQDAGSGSAEN